MEKLIELLNECKPTVSCANFKEHYEFIDDDIYLIREWIDWEEEQFPMYVCYKKWNFVKWLVENNKIEWSEKTAFVTFLEREINADKSDALVSLLAVQDNPIEYLCSILK